MSVSPYLLKKPCKTCGLLWDREGGLGPELNQPHCPACRNMQDVYPDLKIRFCLKCDRRYLSISPKDRVCPPCREKNRMFANAEVNLVYPSIKKPSEWCSLADCHSQPVELSAGPNAPGLYHQEQPEQAAHQYSYTIYVQEDYLNDSE